MGTGSRGPGHPRAARVLDKAWLRSGQPRGLWRLSRLFPAVWPWTRDFMSPNLR